MHAVVPNMNGISICNVVFQLIFVNKWKQITTYKFLYIAYDLEGHVFLNGLTSPGSGVIQVVSGQLNSSLVQAIARKGQNNPDVLGSEQVVNNPGTGWK